MRSDAAATRADASFKEEAAAVNPRLGELFLSASFSWSWTDTRVEEVGKASSTGFRGRRIRLGGEIPMGSGAVAGGVQWVAVAAEAWQRLSSSHRGREAGSRP